MSLPHPFPSPPFSPLRSEVGWSGAGLRGLEEGKVSPGSLLLPVEWDELHSPVSGFLFSPPPPPGGDLSLLDLYNIGKR